MMQYWPIANSNGRSIPLVNAISVMQTHLFEDNFNDLIMGKLIKILQLQPFYNVKSDDTSDLAEQIVNAFPKDKYEVTSGYLYGNPGATGHKSRAANSHYFNFKRSDLKGLRIKLLYEIYKHCRSKNYDVVICNRFKTVSPMLQLNKLLKIPLCIGISHVMDEYARSYRRHQVRFLADSKWRLVGVSDAVKEVLINYKCGLNQNNTYAITNAIDTQKLIGRMLTKNEARSELGLPLDTKIIGAVGRLVRVKGHEYLIQAFASIEKKYPNTILAIIGEGKERDRLTRLINNLNINHKVYLLGSKENAAHYIKAFDIFAMPSIQEGLGLALLEGMCGSLPIIASDIPAMRPLITGSGGIAVLPKDIKSLAEAISQYLDLNESELELKGSHCLSYVLQNHTISKYRQDFLNLIESNLSE